MTFADQILQFIHNLSLEHVELPEGIRAMNPYKGEGSEVIQRVAKEFYHKYYSDQQPRRLILGINPGRLGAGATGIPFTDTKRLEEVCDIAIPEFSTHEPSSVFVYELIAAYGGPTAFYRDYFISSICPLGFVKQNKNGRWVNYNYYDSKKTERLLTPFMLEELHKQLQFGIQQDFVAVLGAGKNYEFVSKLNEEHQLFSKVVPLEHPRYIMQYKTKQKKEFLEKYLEVLKK